MPEVSAGGMGASNDIEELPFREFTKLKEALVLTPERHLHTFHKL